MSEYYSIYLPNYTIGHGVYEKIPIVCRDYGMSAVIIGGKTALSKAEAKIRKAAEAGGMQITGTLWYGGECTYENMEKLAAEPAVRQAKLLFAVGGGKATDTTKALGEKINKAVFSFPTITSNCAGCTSVSIMYHEDGSFLEPFFITRPPMHTFLDLDIIAAAPWKYMWAGMGDTYAKYYEATMSSRGEELSHYVGLGVTISRMCLDPILKYGRRALEDNKKGVASKELENIVLAINVTTALVSILVTKDKIIDYNTGLAHAINYGLTSFPEVEQNHLHGEIVSFGVLILLLVESQVNPAFKEQYKEMAAFSADVGLPRWLDDLGLTDADEDRVIDCAIKMKDIDHNPYPITREMVTKAFDTLKGDYRK
ncbi:iron-containing alcohol dehydrogenase family protein [uncultured Pseudoramibacter sp.]|jgi:glycerol dehydrogenase-like iron-containing ADH family enzyme|uniref:iron-containing alcohol dehydrogenase family protein n=1 Tax=uncultured Pseudoramibacter sp. TaxID=1623493 RepID=UPI0025EA6D2A|nr:iron-containing alcohol dehydrogenase family protein [uncultured Pseudoramibacter sp.]